MNKKIKLMAVALLLTVTTAFAQTTKPAWAQMKMFHSYMSSTFHPAEEGNFAPIKAKADSLLIVAKLWKASEIPANYKPKETKTQLRMLVKQCKKISNAVNANEADTVLKNELTKAHDIFHTIAGECKKADE
ncbi:MAG: hypothetical protein IPP48_05360 [Chitinophagaceae bacterium]|nr:hypothetical protein [Chitinophagaceae bacterium]